MERQLAESNESDNAAPELAAGRGGAGNAASNRYGQQGGNAAVQRIAERLGQVFILLHGDLPLEPMLLMYAHGADSLRRDLRDESITDADLAAAMPIFQDSLAEWVYERLAQDAEEGDRAYHRAWGTSGNEYGRPLLPVGRRLPELVRERPLLHVIESRGEQTRVLGDEILQAFMARHEGKELVELINAFYSETSDDQLERMFAPEYPRMRRNWGIRFEPSQFRQACNRFRNECAEAIGERITSSPELGRGAWEASRRPPAFSDPLADYVQSGPAVETAPAIESAPPPEYVLTVTSYLRESFNVAPDSSFPQLLEAYEALRGPPPHQVVQWLDGWADEREMLFALPLHDRMRATQQSCIGDDSEESAVLRRRALQITVEAAQNQLLQERRAEIVAAFRTDPQRGAAAWREHVGARQGDVDPMLASWVEPEILPLVPEEERRFLEEREQRRVVEDLGDINGFGDDFFQQAGRLIELLVPAVGDKKKLQLNVNIPLADYGAVSAKLSFQFMGEIERDTGSMKMRVEVGGGVTGEIDAAIAEVFAQAMIFGYMEASGDDGAEVFRLFALAISERVGALHEGLGESLYAGWRREGARGALDDDDYVESGLGVDVSAGVTLADTGIDGRDERPASVGVGAKVRFSGGTRITNRGDLDVGAVAVSAKVGWSGFGLEAKVTGKDVDDGFGGLEIEGAGEKMMTPEELTGLLRAGDLVVQLGARLIDCARAYVDKVGGGKAGESVALLAELAGRTGASLADNAQADAQELLQNIGGFNGIQMGYKLTAKLAVDAQMQPSIEITLERMSTIEFGDNPRDTVYVLLENTQRVFQIKVPS